MTHVYFVCFLISIITLFVNAEEKYTTKYDNVNFEEIMSSDRLLKNYINCLMDRGPCTPDAAELKRVLPEALESSCVKCSEKQRKGVHKVLHYLVRNREAWWAELATKYDPNGIYKKKIEEEWAQDER